MEDQSRRTFLGIASLLPIALGPQAPAQRPNNGELARYALAGPFEGFEAVALELNFPPGAGGAHRHPGFVLGYVAEGRLRFTVNNEPEKIVSAGSTFLEPLGAVHTTNGSANADGPARVVVFMVVPKGSAVVGPA